MSYKHKPFNDAIDHLQKIEGYPRSSGAKLPLPIKIIGYLLAGSMTIILLLGLIGNFLYN